MKKSILIFAFSLITALSFGQLHIEVGNKFIKIQCSNNGVYFTGESIINQTLHIAELKTSEITHISIENYPMDVQTIDSIDVNLFKIQFPPNLGGLIVTFDLQDIFESQLSTPIVNINSVSIYPNPVNDYLNISINGTENVILTNLNGQIIFNDTIYSECKIGLLNQSNGIYILQIANQFHKIVKQ